MDNADWKKMYLSLLGETENAINALIAAQRKCEEMYLQASEERKAAGEAQPAAAEKKIG